MPEPRFFFFEAYFVVYYIEPKKAEAALPGFGKLRNPPKAENAAHRPGIVSYGGESGHSVASERDI